MDRDTDIFKQLNEIDWAVFSIQLAALASRLAKSYSWNTGGVDLLGEGNTPKDIAQRVILKAYSGERSKPVGLDIKTWLFGQVRSEISNLHRRYGHQKEFAVVSTSEDEDAEDLQDQFEFISIEDGIFSYAKSLTPEEELLKTQLSQAYWNAVAEAIDNDPDLLALVENMKFVGDKPQDLAKALNQPVKTVYNLLRRLRRRVESSNQDE